MNNELYVGLANIRSLHLLQKAHIFLALAQRSLFKKKRKRKELSIFLIMRKFRIVPFVYCSLHCYSNLISKRYSVDIIRMYIFACVAYVRLAITVINFLYIYRS